MLVPLHQKKQVQKTQKISNKMKKYFLIATMALGSFIALPSCNQGEKAGDATTTAPAADANAAAAGAVAADPNAAANPAGDPAAAAAADAAAAAANDKLPKTSVKFNEMEHDFGKIKAGDKVTYAFKFKNNGKEPLIINSAKGSCGCTVPNYPKEPVAPGAEGVIDVEFNSAGKSGAQTKTVTINANTDPNPTRLTIKAEVEGGAAPAAAPGAPAAGH